MAAESETRRGMWLIYATTFAVVFPVLYVLSSGPALCIEQTESGSLKVGSLHVKADPTIPYRQGSFYHHHWVEPIAKLYLPLNWVATSRVRDVQMDSALPQAQRFRFNT